MKTILQFQILHTTYVYPAFKMLREAIKKRIYKDIGFIYFDPLPSLNCASKPRKNN